MKIDTDAIASVEEAIQDFSRVAQKADKYGAAVMLKDGRPKYLLVDLERDDLRERELTDDEQIDTVARQLLKEYRQAFPGLAE